MSRLAATFEALKADNKTALVPYIMCADPDIDTTLKLMHELVKSGCNIIELGVPFSDPMADGPVIQAAAERVLVNHVSLRDVIAVVARFRQTDSKTPVILMGYLNPIEVMGYAEFAEQAAAAGVDGALTVDIPPEEAEEYTQLLKAQGIDPIYLLAPTSDDGRIASIGEVAAGFVYYVSLKGVTGAASLDIDSVADKLQQIRQQISLPVGVGFGIGDAETAAKISRLADAVVVGSAIVKRMAEFGHEPEQLIKSVTELTASMRKAMDQANK
ncbi:MAG: tryptophan synthase subunit alpha [Gammaproteobacteria bacterium]|nr:tryptophan synthase subunit alpha [Gammaproteobacteria bacterium]